MAFNSSFIELTFLGWEVKCLPESIIDPVSMALQLLGSCVCQTSRHLESLILSLFVASIMAPGLGWLNSH